MTDKRTQAQKKSCTCFEGGPFAEMMEKMKGGQGVGSLCAEMMKKIADGRQADSRFDCREMMERMMTMCDGRKKEEEKPPKE